MKLSILKHGRMVEKGQSALRSIQNNQLPIIDLIVRECIQNSLDASCLNREDISVNIKVKRINCKSLLSELEGINPSINNKLENESDSLCLLFSDKGTIGLNGDYGEKAYSNIGKIGTLEKLVYQIGCGQCADGCGGLWGLGKTVCFSAGLGIVFYYSRSIENGKYRHVFAGTLLEKIEENINDSVLDPSILEKIKSYTGIAWWGDYQQNTSNDIFKDSVPYEYWESDSKTIEQTELGRLLSIFGIKPYNNDKTGTVVIIPFISPEKLLGKEEVNGSIDEKIDIIDNALTNSLYRWYFPRLSECYRMFYPNKTKLNIGIRQEQNTRFYQIMDTLFENACSKLKDENFESISNIHTKLIKIEDYQKRCLSSAGCVAWTYVSAKDVGAIPPYNEPSPITQIGCQDDLSIDEEYQVILCYSRAAGMIVRYEVDTSVVKKIEAAKKEGLILLVYFVPSINFKVSETMSLDEYLRKSELADHNSWSDITLDNNKKQTYLSRIMKRIVNSIIDSENIKIQPQTVTHDIKLQKDLGILLGSISQTSQSNKPAPQKPHFNYIKKNNFNISNSYFDKDGDISIKIDVTLKDKSKLKHEFNLNMATECNGDISYEEWIDTTDKEFPFCIDTTKSDLSMLNSDSYNWIRHGSKTTGLIINAKADIDTYTFIICTKSIDDSVCYRLIFEDCGK